ncbi:aflatoxin B1 aldehyde reductase member 2 [Plectosphaerella plurivora]|uniref:Aflatoxin B1 aldehyde reductase member 2 n=1 Tax=Plectosphaerella plurivora TaxID=936078 RepID=A0A9P9A7Q7_9PEZI|nr:aflatoxin B1 aldehyde reductase member 2 [Plectosphaerella plurivora]
MSTTTRKPLNLVLGCGNVGDTAADTMARFDTPDEVKAFLDIFLERGHTQLDTARGYSPGAPGTSEPRLAAVGAGNRAIIDTKIYSFQPGNHQKAKVTEAIDDSLSKLNIKQINIMYLHAPERTTPLEETCEAMNQAHREGKIKHWGVSNLSPDEVQSVIDICNKNEWVKPSVYEGHYNPIVRGGEKGLFPLLRKNGIAFYAYSPAAGGFFARGYDSSVAGTRFDAKHPVGGLYRNLYVQPAVTAAADKVVEVAAKHGIKGHAASLRWTLHHSILSADHGDSVIVGASSLDQLKSNLDTTEQGPLPDDLVAAFEVLNSEIAEVVPYHF